MILVIARVVLVEKSALRPVSLKRRRPPVDRDRQIVFALTVRLAFPTINVNVATPDVRHPTIALVNVNTWCSHTI